MAVSRPTTRPIEDPRTARSVERRPPSTRAVIRSLALRPAHSTAETRSGIRSGRRPPSPPEAISALGHRHTEETVEPAHDRHLPPEILRTDSNNWECCRGLPELALTGPRFRHRRRHRVAAAVRANGSVPSITILISRPARRSRTGTDRSSLSSSPTRCDGVHRHPVGCPAEAGGDGYRSGRRSPRSVRSGQ